MARKINDRSASAIGGGVLLGLDVGFFFLPESALAFVVSLLAGLGLGLIVTSVLSGKGNDDWKLLPAMCAVSDVPYPLTR